MAENRLLESLEADRERLPLPLPLPLPGPTPLPFPLPREDLVAGGVPDGKDGDCEDEKFSSEPKTAKWGECCENKPVSTQHSFTFSVSTSRNPM